jgi:glucose dehydrogenase
MSGHHFPSLIGALAGSFGAGLVLPAALLASVTMLAAAGAGGSNTPPPATTTFPGATPPWGQWPYPNGDLANTRVAPGSMISSANVSQLREAWSFKLTGKAAAGVSYGGALTAIPVVSDGVVYMQDQDANVYALALATGKLEWEYQVDVLSLATGKVEWDTKVPTMPLGAATVSNNLVFTDLYNGVLIALNRATGEIVYRHQLPTSANAPIAVFGNTVLVPAGAPETSSSGKSGHPQLVAYTVP